VAVENGSDFYKSCECTTKWWGVALRRIAIRLGIASAITATIVVGVWIALDRRGWHGSAEPPQVGETATAIAERLGPPAYDSRVAENDNEQDYELGYTDGLGTRHHLHVSRGVVTGITYSSR
jgi:hypothetical protein